VSAGGVTVRNDTGVYEGGEIPLFYDPMIAKLVTHAKTREAAIDAQADALDAFTVEGIRHNIPFLAALMQHPRWRAGELSTGFIAEEFPHGFHPVKPEGETARVMAAVATAIDHVLGERKRKISGQLASRAVTRATKRVVWLADGVFEVEVTGAAQGGEAAEWGEAAGGARVSLRFADAGGARKRGARTELRLQSAWKPGDVLWSGTVGGARVSVHVRPIANGFELAYRGIEAKAYVFTETEADAARLMPINKTADSGKALRCPMPGLVLSIAVAEGQEVKAGETLAVVEAMKMENVLRAERDGTVKSIHARPGDSLAVDAVIMEFA
jgi:propionyl-CoA carboxylase alpha chain